MSGVRTPVIDGSRYCWLCIPRDPPIMSQLLLDLTSADVIPPAMLIIMWRDRCWCWLYSEHADDDPQNRPLLMWYLQIIMWRVVGRHSHADAMLTWLTYNSKLFLYSPATSTMLCPIIQDAFQKVDLFWEITIVLSLVMLARIKALSPCDHCVWHYLNQTLTITNQTEKSTNMYPKIRKGGVNKVHMHMGRNHASREKKSLW